MRNGEPQPQLRNPQMKSALCAQQTHFNPRSLQKDAFSLSLPQLAYRTARLLKGPLWSLGAASPCSPLSPGCLFPVLSWIEWVLAATEASLVWKAVVTGTPTGLLSQCTIAAKSSLGPSFVTEAHLQMHYFHQESNTAAGAGAGNAG